MSNAKFLKLLNSVHKAQQKDVENFVEEELKANLIDKILLMKNPKVFIPFLNERDDMGRIIRNNDLSLYKLDENTGNLLAPPPHMRKFGSLTQRELNKTVKCSLALPAIPKENKPKSQSLHQFIETFAQKQTPASPSTKLIETQRRFFKMKEKVFTNTGKLSENMENSRKMLKKSWSLPKKFADSPTRFYKNSETGDIYRRSKPPSCLIFKENQHNSHEGLYKSARFVKNLQELEEKPTRIPKNKSVLLRNEENYRKNQEDLQRNLAKELSFAVNKKELRMKVSNIVENMFKFTLKPSDNFFKSNEDFLHKFASARDHARVFQAKQAKYSSAAHYTLRK